MVVAVVMMGLSVQDPAILSGGETTQPVTAPTCLCICISSSLRIVGLPLLIAPRRIYDNPYRKGGSFLSIRNSDALMVAPELTNSVCLIKIFGRAFRDLAIPYFFLRLLVEA